ncbi:MAG: hypothetical protein QM813_01610 [Verrucomicrobiota bacterium]
MNPISIQSLASVFSFVGTIIGIPSLTVLLLYAINEIRNHMSTATTSTNFGENPDAILLTLKVVTNTLSGLANFIGNVGQLLFNGIAIVAGGCLLLAIALWLTGRGLQTNTNWARVSAFILLMLAMLPSILLALSLHNFARVLMLLIVTICVLGLRALFADHIPQTH